MTITIPTADLLGIVGDVQHFAGPDDFPDLHVIQLLWDGTMLHACAHDTLRAAVSSWHPTDRPDKDVQDDLFCNLGGADDPWDILVTVPDAADLLRTFKPRKGLEYAPLHVDCHDGLLKVRRNRAAHLSAAQVEFEGQVHTYPDLRAFHVEALTRAEKVEEISYSAALMADFAKPRQRGGPMTLTFGGESSPTVVQIGERFVGSIKPVRVGGED